MAATGIDPMSGFRFEEGFQRTAERRSARPQVFLAVPQFRPAEMIEWTANWILREGGAMLQQADLTCQTRGRRYF